MKLRILAGLLFMTQQNSTYAYAAFIAKFSAAIEKGNWKSWTGVAYI